MVRRRPGVHQPWQDVDLGLWHTAHADPHGLVWAVTPPCGRGRWALYPPGAPTGGAYPYKDVAPASTHPTAGFGGDHDWLALADVEAWMRPWVERVSGGRVLAMVEGWGATYGPRNSLREYVIYARVEVTR
ncbi:hypothetical protein FDG2_0113 [Candidatus Protofrankia californiensis]|uniref:Uncharacterized protein n=1 Tax=Candidatus Protofrankia californiensis TaxID=1839754 RepID=A0A1C3NSX2_9ACTN|nr:hypothetical protein FDG2_0113 [Candidatus Protofrankia californiensis]